MRVVLLAKRRLEVLDVVQATALLSHYCFLLSEHTEESTNCCYNIGDGAYTTLTYLHAELNIMVTL